LILFVGCRHMLIITFEKNYKWTKKKSKSAWCRVKEKGNKWEKSVDTSMLRFFFCNIRYNINVGVVVR
jgi:hypothetical protein